MRASLACSVLSLPAAAVAQDLGAAVMNSKRQPTSPTGIGLPNDGPTLLKLAAYGRCISGKSGNTVRVLAAPPESDRDREALANMSLLPEYCSRHGNFFRFAPMFLRGSYAEYSLVHDFDLTTSKPRGRPDKIFRIPTPEERQALSEKEKAALSFVEYGTCIAKVDMPGIAKLMAAEVGSAAERVAFQALAPTMSQCLTPGLTVRVNRFKLRGYLAEGAYRWLSAKATQ